MPAAATAAMSRLLAALALVLVLCVSRCHASSLVFSVSAEEQSYLNALHSPSALSHARALESAFASLDSDADGELSAQEMDEHESAGRMSAAERALVAAFDRDASGSLSAAELMLAPHALNMLETSVQFDALRPAVRPSAQERAAADAFDGMQAQPRTQQPLYRLKSRRTPAASQTSEWGADQSLSEIGAWAEPAAAAAAPATAAAGAAPAAAAAAPRVPGQRRPSTRASKGSRRGAAPLPVSLFGVPSVADEECVMCQYFVQRIQNDIAARLENAPGAAAASTDAAAAAGAAGLKAGAAAAQQALKVRSLTSQLQKRPGGRGIVRVVTEDVVSRLCAVDRMPQLFYPYCLGLSESNAIHAVRKAVFFNIPTVEVCSQAALCRDDAYLNTNAAVHATKTSLFLNGQRGICGMLGGARDRPNSREGLLLNAVCAAHGVVFGEMLVQ